MGRPKNRCASRAETIARCGGGVRSGIFWSRRKTGGQLRVVSGEGDLRELV